MTFQSKRAWRLQEFAAHAGNVNCLALGPKKARLMVTGGEDRKVNLWTIGSPTVTLSLSGHTSGIDCVNFDDLEEHIVAGSASGTIKLWNIDKAQVTRTLSGHKANISALSFHTYGKFLASGSLDTNVRLWDTRRQGCICTYKGHGGRINCLKFSPDGKWIVTGSEDGTVKMWDLGTSKVLHEFKLHSDGVSCLEFHPSEFLLATGSSDKTIKFWDLETFDLVSTTSPEAKPIRRITYDPNGEAMFSGAEDSLRVYGWEPARVHDSLHIFWGKIADMTVHSNQMIGASFQHTNVSVWVVDIGKLKPFNGDLTPLTEPTEAEAIRPPPAPVDGAAGGPAMLPPIMHSNAPPRRTEPPVQPAQPAKIGAVKRTPPRQRKNLQHWEQPGPTQEPRYGQGGNQNADPNAANVAGAMAKISLLDPPVEPVITEQDCLKTAQSNHRGVRDNLEVRLRNLQYIRTVWSKGDFKDALEVAIGLQDQGVTVDILQVIHGRPEIWDLHTCTILLPALRPLFHSKHENHLFVACSTLKHIIRSFGQLIKDNLNAPPVGNIDITREERYKKCHLCHQQIANISREITRHSGAQGKLGSAIREIIKLSESFY